MHEQLRSAQRALHAAHAHTAHSRQHSSRPAAVHPCGPLPPTMPAVAVLGIMWFAIVAQAEAVRLKGGPRKKVPAQAEAEHKLAEEFQAAFKDGDLDAVTLLLAQAPELANEQFFGHGVTALMAMGRFKHVRPPVPA